VPSVGASYDQALAHATSTLTVVDGSSTNVPGTDSFSPDSKTITFTPTSAFGDGSYTATATAKDAARNTTTTTCTFTLDSNAPISASNTPPDRRTAQLLPSVAASYDQALDHATSTLTVVDGSSTNVPGTDSFSTDSKTIIFTPTSAFGDGTYTATAT